MMRLGTIEVNGIEKQFEIGDYLFQDGLTVFGLYYPPVLLRLLEWPKKQDTRILVLDGVGNVSRYASRLGYNVIDVSSETINPLKCDGKDKETYLDLLCEALKHSFMASSESVEESKQILRDLITGDDDPYENYICESLISESVQDLELQFTTLSLLRPLFLGASTQVFRGKQTIDLRKLSKPTVLNLFDIFQRSIKTFLYTLILAKLIIYLREYTGEDFLLTICEPQFIWPPYSTLPFTLRSGTYYISILPFLLQRIRLVLAGFSWRVVERSVLEYFANHVNVGPSTDFQEIRVEKAGMLTVKIPGLPQFNVALSIPRKYFTTVELRPRVKERRKLNRLQLDFRGESEKAREILMFIKSRGASTYDSIEEAYGVKGRSIAERLRMLHYLKYVKVSAPTGELYPLALTDKGYKALRGEEL